MKPSTEFIRFCSVGIVCYVTGLLLLAFLTEFVGLHYALSFSISFVVTNLLGFRLNGRFSFGGVAATDRRAGARYFAISAASLAANSAALVALVELGGMWYLAAVMVLTAINVPINFIAHRTWTYRAGRVASARYPQ